jgi:Domain of unknown function (DUF892)
VSRVRNLGRRTDIQLVQEALPLFADLVCPALGHAQSVKLLRQTLEEEKKTDLLLNKLACDEINARAASNGDDDERAGRKAA